MSKEVEIRFYIDPRVKKPNICPNVKYSVEFQTIVKKILEKFPLKKQTKIIDLFSKKIRKRITLDPRNEEWITKERTYNQVESNKLGGFKISHSIETPINPVKLSNVDRIAVKFRYSIDIGDFILDISANKISNLNNITFDKNALSETKCALNNYSYWDFWEFEFEQKTPHDITLDDIYNLYKYITPMIDYDMLTELRDIMEVCEYPMKNKLSKLDPTLTISVVLPKAIEPSLDEWNSSDKDLSKFIIRDKIDGKRELIKWDKNSLTVISTTMEKWDEPHADGIFICDTEFYNDKWYILHPLVWDSKLLVHLSDSERLTFLDKSQLIRDVEICPVKKITSNEDILQWWNRKVSHQRDGIILSEDLPYWVQKSYKWKPSHESTIDFLIIKCPEFLLGKHPYLETDKTLYLLNCSQNIQNVNNIINKKRYLDYLKINSQFIPWPFSPIDNLYIFLYYGEDGLHGKIGEFIFSDDWKLKKIRDDKTSIIEGGNDCGNSYKTAISIWSKYKEPFNIEDLYLRKATKDPVEDYILEYVDWNPKTLIVHLTDFKVKAKDKAFMTNVNKPTPLNCVPIIYTQIAKVNLTGVFIGGANTFITTDPMIPNHLSCIVKFIIPGGDLIIIGNSNDIKDAEKHNLLLLNMDKVENMYILHFKKEVRGMIEMSLKEIHDENPHLHMTKYANFSYKYSRGIPQELQSFRTLEDFESCEDIPYGQLLIDIEFIISILQKSKEKIQVLRIPHEPKLEKLFPQVTWLLESEASDKNVEYFINHTFNDTHSYNPILTCADINSNDLPKGKFLIYPWANDRIAVVYGKKEMTKIDMEQTLKLLNRGYKQSCFKFNKPSCITDYCYNCRTASLILSKYAAMNKLSINNIDLKS